VHPIHLVERRRHATVGQRASEIGLWRSEPGLERRVAVREQSTARIPARSARRRAKSIRRRPPRVDLDPRSDRFSPTHQRPRRHHRLEPHLGGAPDRGISDDLERLPVPEHDDAREQRRDVRQLPDREHIAHERGLRGLQRRISARISQRVLRCQRSVGRHEHDESLWSDRQRRQGSARVHAGVRGESHQCRISPTRFTGTN
jgi:hypothetical protein